LIPKESKALSNYSQLLNYSENYSKRKTAANKSPINSKSVIVSSEKTKELRIYMILFPAEKRVNKAFKQKKRVAFSFGSSLAYGFYFNKSKEYLAATKKQPPETQNKIRDWEIIHFGIPGSTVISHYVRLEQMLERGLKPNLILVELAPNSFNANSPWYTAEIVNAIPLDFALKHFREIPFAHLRIILISRIFVLSYKRLGKPTETYNLLHGYFQKFIYDYGKQEEQQTSPESFRVGQETVANAFLSQSLLQVLKLDFTNGWFSVCGGGDRRGLCNR
jgi:hypothetical protein